MTEPTNGRWISFAFSTVYPDARYSGPQHTIATDPLGGDKVIRFYVVGSESGLPVSTDYVTHIEVGGTLYQHQNQQGTNVFGGLHTTSDRFTIQIEQFNLPGFEKIHTLAARQPLAAPCFGPDNEVMVEGQGLLPVQILVAGDRILTREGYRTILWTGGSVMRVTDKNAPIRYQGSIYSPQHRIMHGDQWITARQLVKAGLAQSATHNGSQWYGHILLEEHLPIVMLGHEAESLLPTDLALSAMSETFAKAIRAKIEGRDYRLNYPELKARDLIT